MRRFFFILTLLIAVSAFVFGSTEVWAFCTEAMYPFRRVAEWAGHQLSARFEAAWRGLCDGPSRAVSEDEVERLQVMLRESSRVAQENAELRAALGWAEMQPMRVLAAPVWSHGGGLGVWPRLTLGVGSAQGVAEGDTVVVPEGLVGRVAKGVSRHQCEVILISDPASRVAVEVPGEIKGILFGAQGTDYGTASEETLLYTVNPLRLRFSGRDTKLKPRQIVQTEGSGGRFPRGLVVGRVMEIREVETGFLMEALVEPAADPTLLRTVFVLTSGAVAGEATRERAP